MAFVTATKNGNYEIRESRSTPDGPRSRTLATFRELTDETIEKASERAEKPLDRDRLRDLAIRVGAPVHRRPVERAARELIGELGKGHRLDPSLRHLLLDLLGGDKGTGSKSPPLSDAVRSGAAWMAATPSQRGRALVDLLAFVDALPANGRKRDPLAFPRLDSTSP